MKKLIARVDDRGGGATSVCTVDSRRMRVSRHANREFTRYYNNIMYHVTGGAPPSVVVVSRH